MFDKINATKIVRDHVATLKSFDTDKYSSSDFLLFFFFPLLLSGILVYFKFILSKDFINILATSLSIFAALLLNLLLLIYDILRKSEKTDSNYKLKAKFLKQIYANISFCILISIVTIVFLIIASLNIKQLESILAFGIYSLVFIFVLTLFMVLKRVHILLSKEVSS